jgi:VIT1/CCC1 family predicted Fe2+/Mn2+ transporter
LECVHGIEAFIAAIVISLAAHFAVGAAKSLITIRSCWSSGLEMRLVGAAARAVAFGRLRLPQRCNFC